MSIQKGTVTTGTITREVTYDTKTGASERQSLSAHAHVDNGKRSSFESAKEEARRDIQRGPRERGDTSYRGA
jgi:hypothetical protein